ncbi:Protein of unknown function, partial [Cotesia congregata]
MYKRTIHPVPPWETIKINTNWNLAERDKKITTARNYQSLFHETKANYPHHLEIYTDGSKKDNKAGCALFSEDTTEIHKLPDAYSVFSCELFAIWKTLQLAKENLTDQNLVIYTDSSSSIRAIEDPRSTNPILF